MPTKVAFDEYIKRHGRGRTCRCRDTPARPCRTERIDLENFDYEESDTFDYEGIPFTEAMFSITREITGGCTDDDVLEDKVHSVLNEIFSFCAAQK